MLPDSAHQSPVVADTPRRPRSTQSSSPCKEGPVSDIEANAEACVGSTSDESQKHGCPSLSLPSSSSSPSSTVASSEPSAKLSCTDSVAHNSPLEMSSGADTAEGGMIVKAFSKDNCAGCMQGLVHNLQLRRTLAKVTYRLQKASEIQQTHGQRILRAYYEQKLAELGRGQQRYATQILNQQKNCFEEELEQVEAESRMREASLRAQLEQERARMANMVKAFERERDAFNARTEETVSCLQRKLTQAFSRVSNLEWENAHLVRSLSEKSALVEALIANAEATEKERRRNNVATKTSEDERARKDLIIDALESEVRDLRERLSAEVAINAQLVHAIETVEGNRNSDHAKYRDQLSECRTESKKDFDKLSRLVSSLIQDFVDSQGNVSTHPEGSRPGKAHELQ